MSGVLRGRGGLFAALAIAFCGCDARPQRAAPQPAPTSSSPATAAVVRAPAGWLKGQLHAHTGRSADSATDPAEAAAWYAARGYDFVVFTDHNVVTETASPPGLIVLRGVELTQNLRTCDPPPDPGERCLLHATALFVRPDPDPIAFDPGEGRSRLDLYARAVDRGIALGGLVQLDHPNFHHGADASLIVALARRGVTLVEVENRAVDSGNDGDATHPSTEAMWDAALARGARVFGTATDDAHHYGDADRVRARGGTAYTGDRGFVMVRAERSPEAIRAAIATGDFYASRGLVLDRVDLGRDAIAIDARRGSAAVTFELVADGRVVEVARGAVARWDLSRRIEKVVRVRVRDETGSLALTQPVWR